jgi:hypothetical protein
MSLSTQISLPNGLNYEQPLGLFIDNQFVVGNGEAFEVVEPAYVLSSQFQA